METEEKDPYNKGLSKIVEKLYKLREIEFNKQSFAKKYNKAKVLIDEVTFFFKTRKISYYIVQCGKNYTIEWYSTTII